MKAVKLLGSGLLLSLAAGSFAAENAGEGALAQEGVPYTRIVTDANGESHFEDGVLPFNAFNLPTGHTAGRHRLEIGAAANIMMFPSGVFEDWHPTPNAQTLIVIQGEVEVGVSDGEKRSFGPGDVVIMNDNSGKGHTTRTFGDVPHVAMMIRQPVE